MKRWVIVGVCVLGVVLLVGLVITYIPRLRQSATQAECRNNFRELGLFAVHHAQQAAGPDAAQTPLPPGVSVNQLLPQIPAGTILLPGVPPEQRLSWYVAVLPGLDQKRQNMQPLLAAIDTAAPWMVDRNQAAARTRLVVALCPGNTPTLGPDQPAPTSYVGIAGLGPEGPTIPLPPPPERPSPRSGCFRYDTPTPFAWQLGDEQVDTIRDGLSQTLLLGERSGDVGPWLRGGPATVRPLDDRAGAPLLVGGGGQFGGCHPNGAYWSFADGSARFLRQDGDPRVLLSLATIAGGEQDPVPGE